MKLSTSISLLDFYIVDQLDSQVGWNLNYTTIYYKKDYK